jgi:hypothetical protein
MPQAIAYYLSWTEHAKDTMEGIYTRIVSCARIVSDSTLSWPILLNDHNASSSQAAELRAEGLDNVEVRVPPVI